MPSFPKEVALAEEPAARQSVVGFLRNVNRKSTAVASALTAIRILLGSTFVAASSLSIIFLTLRVARHSANAAPAWPHAAPTTAPTTARSIHRARERA